MKKHTILFYLAAALSAADTVLFSLLGNVAAAVLTALDMALFIAMGRML